MEGETNRDDACPEGFDSLEGSPNSHVDRLVSLGNRVGSVESSGDQINRCWDHDYDWLLLDDDSSVADVVLEDGPPEPSTAISPVGADEIPVHYTKSSWGSSNALQGPSIQHLAALELMEHMLNQNNSMNGPSSLLLHGEEMNVTSLAASIVAHPRIASELDPLNYFQIDWSYTPRTSASSRNDYVCWIPFPRIGPFHQSLEESSGEDSHRRRLIRVIVGALSRYEFGDEDYMPIGELLYGFSELYIQNIDMRLDLGILGELSDALPWNWGSTGLSEEMIRASLKERKHGASESVERCCICQKEYVDGDDLGILECRHEFHMSCIEKWLLLKNRCPICNRKAMETDSSE